MTSSFVVGNIYLFLSILFGAGAQVLLKRLLSNDGLSQDLRVVMPALLQDDPLAVVAVGAMIVVGFWLWMESLSRLPLSYAYPITCGSALFVMTLSAAFLGEAVTWNALLGAALIALGATLIVLAS